jgi:DNA/RNA endonuclease YhcR with UshA esterase domain
MTMNKITRNIKNLILFAILSLFLFSCDKEVAIAPYITYDGEANWTIRELLEYGEGQLPDSTITGIVVSSDEQGNFYKTLVIQDETGGIQIKIANTSLFNRYPIGQQVFVKCQGLRLGQYGGLPQVGTLNPDDPTRLADIPSKLEFNHIYRHGLVKKEPAPFTITATTTEADLLDHLNMYIEIPDVSFKVVGVPFVDPYAAIAYTSRELSLSIGGKKLVVNTSKYVKPQIALALTPPGKGTVRGILTKFNNDYQIVLRSIKDIDFKIAKTIYDLEEHLEEPMFGWRQVKRNANGVEWSVMKSQKSFQIIGNNEESDSWLISPNLDLSTCSNPYIELERMILPLSDTHFSLYYSTVNYNPNDPFQINNWTEMILPAYNSEVWDYVNLTLPTSVKAVALRYSGSDAKVYVRAVKIIGLEQY